MSQLIQVQPVILCGGSGTRLWPLSRKGFPKQFLTLTGSNSLFQQAVERIIDLCADDISVDSTLVVTNEEHRFMALEQLREINHVKSSVLLEPIGRNTAPALTIAALEAISKGQDPILVVTPADQVVQDLSVFKKTMQHAIRVASNDAIVILGIKPSIPKLGYGYIRCEFTPGDSLDYKVAQFVEKPSLNAAEQYLLEGGYFWNSGIFVLRASLWLKTLKKFRLDIADGSEKSMIDKKVHEHFIRPNKTLFEAIPSESIDYAVMEKCTDSGIKIRMIHLDAGWSDLGAWDAVWEASSSDSLGNFTEGDVILKDSNNTYVHASNRLVAGLGIEDLIIIETADAVLVADKFKAHDLKKIVQELESQNRKEKDLHRKICRPWGWYDSIEEGLRFKVKRIMVNPGASLSLQLHNHRAEHWVVVSGVAEVTVGEKKLTLTENQSIFIPKGEIHRLENKENEPLEIIEVQSGSYLGEDDIVRFQDIYGR